MTYLKEENNQLIVHTPSPKSHLPPKKRKSKTNKYILKCRQRIQILAHFLEPAIQKMWSGKDIQIAASL